MSFDNALEVSNVFLKDENLIDTSEFLSVELTKQEDVPLTVDENHLNLVNFHFEWQLGQFSSGLAQPVILITFANKSNSGFPLNARRI